MCFETSYVVNCMNILMNYDESHLVRFLEIVTFSESSPWQVKRTSGATPHAKTLSSRYLPGPVVSFGRTAGEIRYPL